MRTYHRCMSLDRRAFVSAAAGFVGALALPSPRGRRDGRTRLILLGTGGGPRPKKENNATSQVIEQMWIDAARRYFSGEIVAGRDLMEI